MPYVWASRWRSVKIFRYIDRITLLHTVLRSCYHILNFGFCFFVHSIADAFAVSSMSALSGERSAMKRIRKTILVSARLRYCRSVISVVVGAAVVVIVFAFFVLMCAQT